MTHPSHSSSDRIRLTGLSARGYHGVLPSERQEGQLFSVDLVLDLGQRGTAVAAQTDSLDDAVDYSVIAGQVIELIEGEPVNLIETLAERVADVALAHHRVRSVRVTVHKPQAPLTVAFDDVAVSILRTADTEWEDDGARPAAAPAPAAAAAAQAAVPPAPLPSDEDEAAAAAGLPEGAEDRTNDEAADDTEGAGAVDDEQVPSDSELQESGIAAAALVATPVAAPTGGAAAAAAAFAAASAAADESAATGVDSAESAGAVEDQDESDEEDPAFEAAPQEEAAPEAEQPEEAEPQVDPLDQRPEGRPAEIVIALGGNVGGVVPALRQAVAALRETEGIEVTAVAPLARTQALTDPGAAPQPDYLNTVVLASTTLSPRGVLDLCHQLEDAAGRVRTQHWGPRTLDADLVDYEGVTSDDAELTLPHPRAAERAFVLVPWSHADPFAELGGEVVAELADQAPDRDGVRWLALDWIDSDHLPALPTGQYVAPPAPSAGSAPAPADGPESQGV